MIKTVFISYSWKTKSFADKIANDLAVLGIKVIKDNLAVSDFQNLKSFMENISDSDHTLILLSDEYLKSRNCMFEVLELFKSNINLDSILPIQVGELKIFKAVDRINYINFWESNIKELETKLEKVNPLNATSEFKELKVYKDIAYKIGEFLSSLADIKLVKYESLVSNNYIAILEKLEIEGSVEHLKRLLGINFIGDPIKQASELEKYHNTYGSSSHYYYVLAKNFSLQQKYDQAIKYYELSLELDPNNFEVLNNLGFLQDKYKSDYLRAEELYQSSIENNPQLSISRLNYAVLLKTLGRIDEAIFQNKAILGFEPCNSAAHSNLGAIYKSPGKNFNLDLAEEHLLKSIECDPTFINGLMNYGNFLKLYKKEIEEGNSYYKKALDITEDESMKELIKILIKSKKG